MEKRTSLSGLSVRSPVYGADQCSYTGITLTRYMRDISRANPELRELEDLISGIQQVILSHNLLKKRLSGKKLC